MATNTILKSAFKRKGNAVLDLAFAFGAILACAPAVEARDRSVAIAFEATHPCPSTGANRGGCPGFIRDHWIPLCAGGPDSTDNMWWEEADRSYQKDEYEVALCQALDRAETEADKASAWAEYWASVQSMGGAEAARIQQ